MNIATQEYMLDRYFIFTSEQDWMMSKAQITCDEFWEEGLYAPFTPYTPNPFSTKGAIRIVNGRPKYIPAKLKGYFG
jgi:hypothetical protein